ncbi:zinc finger protein 26-like [Anopheles marshallii]|uniref:zinc finger protein 26-like n=1 Tax=Anopheles marshallii TaxID=1521116 RepID=UPI00237AF99C|nr:zinc finger protein 26-like [Anopheles marshallii]
MRNLTLGRFLVGQGGYPRSGIKSAPPAGIIGFPGAAVGAIPFVFPFAPLGLGLFDTDPQRLLSLLHHQSALAEEALRYRSLLFGGTSAGDIGPGSPTATSSQPPLLDDCKEPLNLHATTTPANTNTTSGNNAHDRSEKAMSNMSGTSPKVAMTMIRVRDGLTKEGFRNGGGEELLLRKPPPPTPSVSTSSFAPSSSSSSSTCDDALSLFRDVRQLSGGSPTPATSTGTPTASTDTKCHICMANFPSVWLLEQHSALQHPHLTIHDDKPYLCGLCGQKSRYACCRYRTVLAKHHRTEPGGRSRVPADKLFTCDVCGMQFRYLKSFKKHRLNHALERLHGKKGSGGVGATPADSEPAVSSTNEGGDGAAASSAMVADLRSLTACADGDAESVHGEGGLCVQEKSATVCGEIAVAGSTVTTGGDEQDDTVSDSALNQTSTVEDSAGPSSGAGTVDDTQAKISSSSNSATSTTRNTNCHTNGISNHCTNGGGGGNVGSCQTNSNSTGVTRMVQSPMEAANETLLAGELKRYQVAAVAAAAAAANSAAHHHASVVRSMEAESSSAHATGGGGGGGGSSGGVLQHGLSPSGSSTGPSSLSHTLNSLINAETIPHHRLLGLDPQEASILNFLRVDAAEKQRDRRFACPFCGKCVRSKENLKLHVRKHTGERPFVCLFCGRAFGGKSDLTRHLRIHTGERPYHCEACGKCFARADYLSKHLTTHVHQLSPRP